MGDEIQWRPRGECAARNAYGGIVVRVTRLRTFFNLRKRLSVTMAHNKQAGPPHHNWNLPSPRLTINHSGVSILVEVHLPIACVAAVNGVEELVALFAGLGLCGIGGMGDG